MDPHADPQAPVPELTAYLRDELDASARLDFEAHLPACERCRKAVAVVGTLFPGAAAPPVSGAEPTAAELLAQLEAELARTRARNLRLRDSRRRNLLWALAVLTALTVLAAAGIMLAQRRAADQPMPPVTAGGAP